MSQFRITTASTALDQVAVPRTAYIDGRFLYPPRGHEQAGPFRAAEAQPGWDDAGDRIDLSDLSPLAGGPVALIGPQLLTGPPTRRHNYTPVDRDATITADDNGRYPDLYEVVVALPDSWFAAGETVVAKLLAAGLEEDRSPCLVADDAAIKVRDLPHELFLREFLEVDTADPTEVAGFCLRWGPLQPPAQFEPRDGAFATVLPAAWRDFAFEHEALEWRRSQGLEPEGEGPPDEQLDAAETRAERDEVWERWARKRREAELMEPRRRATLQAAADALTPAITRSGMSRSAHLDAVMSHLFEEWFLPRAYSFPYGGSAGMYTASHDGELLPYTTAAIWPQMNIAAVYQALVRSWIELRPADIATDEVLRSPTPERLTDIWKDRKLPTADTMLDLLGTMQALVNPPESATAVRVELTHPELERDGLAYGRSVPTIIPAICLQLVEWIGEDLPAHRCENETCGRLFTRQRGRAEQGQYRTSGVKYCSATCANAQANREYRRRKRQGPGA